MEDQGWVKLHRKTLNSPVVMKDAAHLAVWVYLLMTASHKDYDVVFGGKRITLHPGQLTTTSAKIARTMGVSIDKVKRILNDFKVDQQIALQSERYGTLISVLNWTLYQDGCTTDCTTAALPPHHERTTAALPPHSIQEYKELKNNNTLSNARGPDDLFHQKPTLDEVKEFCKWRGLTIDPNTFWNYYEARGWKINGQPMENWKASAMSWNSREGKKRKTASAVNQFNKIESHDYNFGDLEKQLLGE